MFVVESTAENLYTFDWCNAVECCDAGSVSTQAELWQLWQSARWRPELHAHHIVAGMLHHILLLVIHCVSPRDS